MPRLPQNISTYYAVKSFASNESEMSLKIELSRHKVLLLIKRPTTFITFRPNVDLQYDITPPNCNLGRPEFSRIFTYFLTRGKQKPLFWPAELILIGILKTVYPTGKVLVSKLGLVLWSNYIYLKRLFGAEIVPLLSFADTGTITSANNLDSRSCYFNFWIWMTWNSAFRATEKYEKMAKKNDISGLHSVAKSSWQIVFAILAKKEFKGNCC